MSKVDFYEMHRIIHRAELQELADAVIAFGGEAHFGPDYTGQGATGTERPCIAANVCDGPEDYYINAVSMKGGSLEIWAEPKDGFRDAFSLDAWDIEFGHVSFITEAIPDNTDKGEPSPIRDITVNTVDGQWVSVNTEKQTWESRQDATYISGSYETDNDRPCTVTGYDGCSSLPYAVRDTLRRLGYALEL